MPRALFVSKNLMGDGLAVSPALRAWHARHPDHQIDLLTLPDQNAELYPRMGVPLRVITDDSQKNGPYDFEHVFDVGAAFKVGDLRKRHIIDAYAELLLGDRWDDCRCGHPIGAHFDGQGRPAPCAEGCGCQRYDCGVDRTATFEPVEEDHPKGLVLISPFSRSCASQKGLRPNKMVMWSCWLHIVTLLRREGRLGCLGGPDDHSPLPVREDEYYCGMSLNFVALVLRDAKWLVTIDNGIAHLAASQGTPTVEFYPACLGIHWVPPAGNPLSYIAQADPAMLQASQAVIAVRQGLRQIDARRRQMQAASRAPAGPRAVGTLT